MENSLVEGANTYQQQGIELVDVDLLTSHKTRKYQLLHLQTLLCVDLTKTKTRVSLFYNILYFLSIHLNISSINMNNSAINKVKYTVTYHQRVTISPFSIVSTLKSNSGGKKPWHVCLWIIINLV